MSASTTQTMVRAGAKWTPAVVALVFLVALNLRPPLTSVGPLLPQIGAEEGLSGGVLGLLGALPLLTFAVISILVHRFSRALGPERAVLFALLLLVAGILIRSYTDTVGLWIGTLVIGAAIAIGNVLVPAIVKRDYSSKVSRATSIYSACMAIGASVASAIAVPLSGAAGWRGSLAFWAIPALIVALLWIPRARTREQVVEPPVSDDFPATSVWKQPTAWLVTAFMGLQSSTFYFMVTWLPTIEISTGISAEQAGVHLFLYQIVGIAAGLAIPRLMRRPDNQIAATVTASVPMLIGVLGMMFVPAFNAVWAVVAGMGTGASLVVALSLIGLRGRSQHETTQLSGMAQSVGYLLASAGPIGAGYLAEGTGGWTVPLLLIALLATVQLVVAVPAGRGRAKPTAV